MTFQPLLDAVTPNLFVLSCAVGGFFLFLLQRQLSYNANTKKPSNSDNVNKDGLFGASRILSNQESILTKSEIADRVAVYEKLYAGARVTTGAISTDASIQKRQDEYQVMVRSFYDLVTDFYEYGWGKSFHFASRYTDESFGESIKRAEHFLAAKLRLGAQSVCLDMGCGIGGPMRNIARFSGAKVEGVTINDYQVRVANRHNEQMQLKEQCHVRQGDFMTLAEFDNDSFDAAYQIEATCHAPNKTEVFKQAYRVLKPGGAFAGYEWAMVGKYDAKNMKHVALKEGIEVGNGLPTIATPDQIVTSLKEAGFEVVEHWDMQKDVHSPQQIPWYDTLHGKMTLKGFRMTRAGRLCTHLLVSMLEFVKIAPKGSIRVSKMLNQTADDLVEAGQMEIFTPSYYFMARKPLQ